MDTRKSVGLLRFVFYTNQALLRMQFKMSYKLQSTSQETNNYLKFKLFSFHFMNYTIKTILNLEL